MKKITYKNSGKIVVLMILLLDVCILSGCSALQNRGKMDAWSKSIFAMDTYMTLTAYGPQAESALDAAIQEIERLDKLLSTGDSESEISKLNRTGKGILSQDSAILWERSLEIYQKSNHALDVTVYPIVKAWGFTDSNYHIPEESLLTEMKKNVNASEVIWDESKKELILPESVELDFGAIAKGYTGYRIAMLMQNCGVESAMLNLGGNIQLIGSKPDGTYFRIGIKHPDNEIERDGIGKPEDENAYLGVLSLKNVAVVTSGDYERFFEENGKRYHHIMDPETGAPADKGLRSVTVICEDGTLADGYSTALFVMGTTDAIRFWKENSSMFEAVFYTQDGELLITEGLEGFFHSEMEYEVIFCEENNNE